MTEHDDTKRPVTLLSSYRKDNKRLLDGAAVGTQRPPRVSIESNRFTLIDPAGDRTEVPFLSDGPALDVVFVDRNEHMSKLYWGPDRAYNPKDLNPSPPICWSDNGTAPSSQASEPQHPTCSGCRHNIIGSAITHKGVKTTACGDFKKFAIVVKGFPGVYQFNISPGSFKAWGAYTKWLSLQKLPDGGRPDLADAVVRIRFVGQGVLSFEATELVTDGSDLAKQVIDIWDRNKQSDITGMMIGRFDMPAQGVLPAPQGASQPASTPPPYAQGQGIFFQPQPQQREEVGKEAFWDKPDTPAKKPRAKKEEQAAPIQPAQPAPHGMVAASGAPPTDVASRLDSLFKLPPVK